MRTKQGAVVLAVVFSIVFAGHAAQEPQEPVFRADAAVVTVDVVVRDRRGTLVTDLTADDFTVRESGVRQRILSFVPPRAAADQPPTSGEPLPASGATATPEDAEQRAPSVVVLAFDRLSPEAQAMAVQAARAYVGDHDQTDDVVGIFSIDSPVRTIQPFTRDATLLRAAIDTLERRAATLYADERRRVNELRSALLPVGVHGTGIASGLVGQSAESGASGPTFAGGGIGAGDPDDHVTWRMLTMELRMLTFAERADRQRQGETAVHGLQALTEALQLTPGRKTVLLFSEGLVLTDPVLPRFQAVIDEANRHNVTFYAVDAQGLRVRSAQADAREDLAASGQESMIGRSSRTGGIQTRDLERNEDVLRLNPSSGLSQLTETTGGVLIQNTNALGSAFDRLSDDMRGHYLLSYTPEDTRLDGRFRPIRVDVARRGVTVQARRGYVAVPSSESLPHVSELFIVDWAETRADAAGDTPHPLQFGNMVLYPNLGQPVSKAASATLAFAFVLETRGHAIDAQLELRRDGQPVAAVVLPLDEPDRDGRIRQVSRLPLETLDPGTYELRVVVRAGGQATAGRAQFTLIP